MAETDTILSIALPAAMLFSKFRLSLVTMTQFVVAAALQDIVNHGGIVLPWNPFSVIPGGDDGSAHAEHHLHGKRHFSAFFPTVDVIIEWAMRAPQKS
jgi:sterol desaturase/sphingolipid hydroxylase (fatty acid hydroxylase superfamily)